MTVKLKPIFILEPNWEKAFVKEWRGLIPYAEIKYRVENIKKLIKDGTGIVKPKK